MESIALRAHIEGLDPIIHKALRERLIARYRVLTGKNPEIQFEDIVENRISTPYIDAKGALVIPFSSDKKYHYWNGGQTITETLKDIEERMKIS